MRRFKKIKALGPSILRLIPGTVVLFYFGCSQITGVSNSSAPYTFEEETERLLRLKDILQSEDKNGLDNFFIKNTSVVFTPPIVSKDKRGLVEVIKPAVFEVILNHPAEITYDKEGIFTETLGTSNWEILRADLEKWGEKRIKSLYPNYTINKVSFYGRLYLVGPKGEVVQGYVPPPHIEYEKMKLEFYLLPDGEKH